MSSEYDIPLERFDNQAYIDSRVRLESASIQGCLRSALAYLYLTNGPANLPRERMKVADPHLEARERLLARWLYTRTNGSLRSTYGSRALASARQARYRSITCGFADVRTLQLDHVSGRTPDTAFACLCANCHCIKSREQDWSGKKRYTRAAVATRGR